ncbi:MAG TPA: signal peptidase II [Bacilli bacterium]|nr:signal peptidase II [Bacilli bacterium]
MYFYVVIALVIGLDQWVKYYIRTHMEIGQSVPLWEGVINLTSHRNPGAAFGILEGQQWFFLLSTLVVVAAVIFYRARGDVRKGSLMDWGLALLVAGAIGNAIDRATMGVVTDFFDLQFVDFAIFNVADVAINVAVGLMILSMLFDWGKVKKQVRESE